MNIHDFTVKDAKGNKIALSQYKGKVLLIVNTATACGLTPQYEGLQALYEKYQPQGLEILDFPCNQFLGQAPGTNDEIVEFCQTKFNTKFKTFGKIEVNGKNTDPLYVYLKEQKPTEIKNPAADELIAKLEELGQAVEGAEIKWNFTKFLIGKDGEVIARYTPTYSPEEIDKEVASLLK